MKSIMLINVKMPTIVGILTFISMKDTKPETLKARKVIIFQHFRFYEISNNVVCATSKGSDQPAHTHSLIRAFAHRLNIL